MTRQHRKPIASDDAGLRHQEALLVRECTRLLGRYPEPGTAIREMLHLASELLGLNRGRVVMPEGDQGELAIRYAYGLTRDEIRRGRYARGEGVTGRVMQTGETAIVQDVDAEPRYLARAVRRSELPQETVSFIALPLESEGRIIGVLGVHRLRNRPRALTDDMAILRTLATLIGQVLQVHRLVLERTSRLEEENRALKQALSQRGGPHAAFGIVGNAPSLQRALHQIEQVAGTEATVLLLGESGTGKELFARALHLQSPRAEGPFVKINCAAIPDTLFEAELFGFEKGAFTGATQARVGRFEQASGGTLFLDEIGDVPLAMQVKLLRVLQERVVERLGSRREIPVDVRIVTATHQDLQRLVDAGRFRLDLFYRLNVIPVQLPALRERPEDIKHLVRHFLNQLNQNYQRNAQLSPEGLAALVTHPWPGNIRQLYNVLERLVLLAESGAITPNAVDFALATEVGSKAVDNATASAATSITHVDSVVRPYRAVSVSERGAIEQALRDSGGNKSRAAQALGLTLRQLNYRIKRLNLPDTVLTQG